MKQQFGQATWRSWQDNQFTVLLRFKLPLSAFVKKYQKTKATKIRFKFPHYWRAPTLPCQRAHKTQTVVRTAKVQIMLQRRSLSLHAQSHLLHTIVV
jgi:hypothetical protein